MSSDATDLNELSEKKQNEKTSSIVELNENKSVRETLESLIDNIKSNSDSICIDNVESRELMKIKNNLSNEKKLDETDPNESEILNSTANWKTIEWQEKINDFDENNLIELLKNASEKELLEVLEETEEINSYLSKENIVFEFILNEDEMVQNTLHSVEVDDDPSAQETLMLSYPAKCYFAQKRLEYIVKENELKKVAYAQEFQNLKFNLESLDMSLKDLKESKEKFDKNIRIGGRHPVTKKIILQKVAKYFDDRIRKKMALTNRYKVQIQTDIRERNKILSQIRAQEKRLASLDMTEFQETQFEHKKSCRQLAVYKDQLGKCKAKFSPLLQSMTEMKKALEKEESEMEKMKDGVSKLEHLKEVILTEKTRNDQKVKELETAMRKIKLDPRRHNLPEVIDYAAAKRENAALKKNIKKWRKKVEQVQQEKLLHINALSKKRL